MIVFSFRAMNNLYQLNYKEIRKKNLEICMFIFYSGMDTSSLVLSRLLMLF